VKSFLSSFCPRSGAIWILIIGSLLILASLVWSNIPVYAQTDSGLRKTTSGGAVDISLQPSPEPPTNNAQSQFKVSFLKKGTSSIQPHIDYDFVIMKNGKEVFSASNQTGQAGKPLHTAESVVTIPYKFSDTGNDYSIKVSVYGILFNPIRPESVEFPIKVVPEFPAGFVGGALATIIGAILIANKFRIIKAA
jgi:hypothetical protein